ncbi:MAG: M81 family metallopeptidase [Bacteroidales bacterium]|nr:M81 family metallopeptidase [Bacteroidales bacterium]
MKQTFNFWVLFLLFPAVFLLITSCGKKGKSIETNEKITILYAEFMHEVNSFNPVATKERDFKADHLFYGEDVIASSIEEEKQPFIQLKN